jgi:hypothetical protein
MHRSAGGRKRPPGTPAAVARGEVLPRDLVEELLELLDHVVGVLDLVLELDRRLGDHLVGGEDRRAGADRQGDRVARARVDLELTAAGDERDRGEERVLAQLSNGDLRAAHLELAEHVAEQIVGHRPRRLRPLQLHQDRGRLRVADPDRQELVALSRL